VPDNSEKHKEEEAANIEAVPPRIYPHEEGKGKESKEQIEENKRVARKFWNDMDRLFHETMNLAKQAHKTNRVINIIIVAAGVVLLANSVAYGWYKQSADAYSVFLGGLGLATFLTYFSSNLKRR
jgi:hypothetical protein